jgi:hypothetical protein
VNDDEILGAVLRRIVEAADNEQFWKGDFVVYFGRSGLTLDGDIAITDEERSAIERAGLAPEDGYSRQVRIDNQEDRPDVQE